MSRPFSIAELPDHLEELIGHPIPGLTENLVKSFRRLPEVTEAKLRVWLGKLLVVNGLKHSLDWRRVEDVGSAAVMVREAAVAIAQTVSSEPADVDLALAYLLFGIVGLAKEITELPAFREHRLVMLSDIILHRMMTAKDPAVRLALQEQVAQLNRETAEVFGKPTITYFPSTPHQWERFCARTTSELDARERHALAKLLGEAGKEDGECFRTDEEYENFEDRASGFVTEQLDRRGDLERALRDGLAACGLPENVEVEVSFDGNDTLDLSSVQAAKLKIVVDGEGALIISFLPVGSRLAMVESVVGLATRLSGIDVDVVTA